MEQITFLTLAFFQSCGCMLFVVCASSVSFLWWQSPRQKSQPSSLCSLRPTMVLIVPCWTWFSAPTSALTRNGLMWMMRDTRRRCWHWVVISMFGFWSFQKTISSSHHIVSKESGKTTQIFPWGDGLQWWHCDPYEGYLIWIYLDVLSLLVKPCKILKGSRVNAGRMIVDPDKIGGWGSTWKRSDFFQIVHNSISSSMCFEASQELTISSWLLERLHVFLNWYFFGWKSEQFDWDICGYLLNLFRQEGADNASMMGFCFTKELVQWSSCKSKPYYYIHKHSTICYNYYNMCCRSCSDISNLHSLEQKSTFYA